MAWLTCVLDKIKGYYRIISRLHNVCSLRRGAMATGLLSKVAGCSYRLHFTVKWLQVAVCQRLQATVKGCWLLSYVAFYSQMVAGGCLSKVAGYCQWWQVTVSGLGYSALVMHLGTSLSEESDCKRLERAATVRMNY